MALNANGLCPLMQLYDTSKVIGFNPDCLGFQVVTASEEIKERDGRYLHHPDSHALCFQASV